MLDISMINKIDSQGMYKVYDRWSDVASNSYYKKHDPVDYKDIDHIVFAGMGGSGAVGDLFAAILSKANIHVSLVKGYLLPKTVDSNTLVVTVSISGNTVETLTVLNAASKQNCKLIAFSSGGQMEKSCMRKKIEFRKIDLMHSPRASFINYVYSILGTLNSIIPINKHDVSESLLELQKTSKNINSSNLTKTNPSYDLARWISGIPMIYYPWGLQAAAVRFKSSLQENAKSHAIIEDVIEASHNGIVSWEKPSGVKPILLEGYNDYIKTKERWHIVKTFFEKNGVDYKEIKSVKGSILTKLVQLIYLLDYASVYYAILNKTDPSPVKSIDFIKKRL
ncbi:SIS domain-containing protein [Candidatus Nitrosotenuis cloacae]|uniref:SIS domain-containing protein n=1 Tax=Candidatus Nitrosotenuis cloacae TaxID=1603555 RepID=UPI0022812FCD|nr:SIS domain-containing protein [Candidatus Nitrosotenuis cloacae]